jgi:hypothetical protein
VSTAGHVASGAGETAMDVGSTIVDLIVRNPRYTRKLWTGGMKKAAYPSG